MLERTTAEETLQALCEAARELVRRGLVSGKGGNVSLRAGHTMYISPRGALLNRLSPGAFVRVDIPSGEVIGEGTPSSEHPMHLACYRARADARAVIHCHPAHVIAVSALGRPLPAMTPDFLIHMRATELPVVPYITPGTQALAKAVEKHIEDVPVVLLGNHGLIAIGTTVEEALTRVLLAEETARIYMLARMVGQPRVLTHQDWEDLQEARYSSP